MTDQSTSQPAQAQAVAVIKPPPSARAISVFDDMESFENAQRIAGALASSNMVPPQYQGKEGVGNCLIAIDFAKRTNSSPLAVMQNLNVIEGRPSWSSPFIIAALNSCALFSPLRFKLEPKGKEKVTYDVWSGPKGQREKKTVTEEIENVECTASATDLATGELLVGTTVSIKMAVAEGWYSRTGSKWKTMPQLMLQYRAAAFFGRIHASHVLMGMHTQDEAEDIGQPVDITPAAQSGPAPQMVQPEPKGDATPAKTEQPAGPTATKAKTKPAPEQKAAPVIDGEATRVAEDQPAEQKPAPAMAQPGKPAADGKELF